MSRAVLDLYEQASELPAEQRAELATLLLDSLEGNPDIEAQWAKEIERRMEEYRAGRVRTVSWDEVRAHLHRPDR
jgi:putative addiction module component (TIGR02574 family)